LTDSVKELIRKIGEDAGRHAAERYEQIKIEIDDEINGEDSVYAEETRKKRESLVSHYNREYARINERVQNRLHQEIIAYQNALIEEIFISALNKLKNISGDAFIRMVLDALKNVEGTFDLYIGELSENKIDRPRLAEAVKGLRSVIIRVMDETVPRKSGFLFKDDRVEYDCLFEDLIDEKLNEQSAEILREVFGS